MKHPPSDKQGISDSCPLMGWPLNVCSSSSSRPSAMFFRRRQALLKQGLLQTSPEYPLSFHGILIDKCCAMFSLFLPNHATPAFDSGIRFSISCISARCLAVKVMVSSFPMGISTLPRFSITAFFIASMKPFLMTALLLSDSNRLLHSRQREILSCGK